VRPWLKRAARARTADDRLLHEASLRVGLQTAAAVAVTVFVLVGIAVLVVLHEQHQSQMDLLSTAITRADDVNDPPAGIWLVIQNAQGHQASPGTPTGFPQVDDLNATARDGAVRTRILTVGGAQYEILTQTHNSDVVQAVLSLDDAHRVRGHLVRALLLCGAFGLVLAAFAGAVLGRRAVAPLAQALALQRRFVADAGHELRTPLTLLSTRAQMIRRRFARNGDQAAIRSEVDGLVTDADRLAAILEDLLLAADPRSDATRGPVALRPLVEQEIAAAQPLAERQGVVVAFRPGDEPVVNGAESSLRRAVNALLDNAIRHATSEVRVTVSATTRQVTVEVADDGTGIDPAILPTLFERFASGSDGSRSTAPRRYGLGLALVAEIAAQHGGTVSAHNNADGAALRVALPRAKDGRFPEFSQDRSTDSEG
jgi:signal transduction histidine kinase